MVDRVAGGVWMVVFGGDVSCTLPDCLTGGVWMVWCLRRCTVYAYVTGCVWLVYQKSCTLYDCLTAWLGVSGWCGV